MTGPGLVPHWLQTDVLRHALLIATPASLWCRVVRRSARSQVVNVDLGLPLRVVGASALSPLLSSGRGFVVVVTGPVTASVSALTLVLVGVEVSCAALITVPRHARGVQGI